MLKFSWQLLDNGQNKFIRTAAAKVISAVFQFGHITIEKIQKRLKKINNRHGTVCVLANMILTEPYSIPSWLPNIFIQLTRYNYDRDVAIKSELEECIKDFKRTHQVGWDAVHKAKFTGEQLEAFYELGDAPSYFV